MAAGGFCLGLVSVALGLMTIVQMLQQSFGVPDRRAGRRFDVEDALAVNPMPDEPAASAGAGLPIVILHTGGQFISEDVESVMEAEFYESRGVRDAAGPRADGAPGADDGSAF